MAGLSRRLQMIAGLCVGPAIVDIGYDHGLLLAALQRQHPGWRLYGVETPAVFAPRGDLPAALDLRMGDGLQAVTGEALDCAVFAGLGEERIRLLLERDWQLAAGLRRLVVCAASLDGRLRPWLAARGWRCAEEHLLAERGRLYLVSACEPGQETERDALRLAMGPRCFDGPDPLLPRWQAFWRRRFGEQKNSGREAGVAGGCRR
jgi:tRNA A22 N-methylase